MGAGGGVLIVIIAVWTLRFVGVPHQDDGAHQDYGWEAS